MIWNHFKVAIRHLLRSKVYSVINIFGLTIGITATLLILMYVANELSYENFHTQRKRIYRVEADFGLSGSKMRFAGVMPALAPALVEKVPDVENAVRLLLEYHAEFEVSEKHFDEQRVFFADPTLFDVFSITLLKGDKNRVLRQPFTMVITEKIAEKYFGDEDPIGKSLLFKKEYPVTVEGVIKDIPPNTHLRCEMIISLCSYESMGKALSLQQWSHVGEVYTYLLLKERRLPENLLESMDDVLRENNSDFAKMITFRLMRLTDIHLKSDAIVDLGSKGNMLYVTVFSCVAFLTLLIACFNFMNLSTARSLRRMREVGMRKVLGAGRLQLIRQFLVESIILAAISVAFGLVLFELVYPVLDRFLGGESMIGHHNLKYLALFIPVIILFVGLLAGCYPAFSLSKYLPADSLAQRSAPTSKRSTFRKVLVMTQFSMTIILVVATIVIFRQLDFMENGDLGFQKENVVLIRLSSGNTDARSKYAVLKEKFSRHPGVAHVSGAHTVPGISSKETKTVWKPGAQDEPLTMQAIAVDYDYIETLGLDIIEGRNFSLDFPSDAEESILLNQEAVRRSSLRQPTGQSLMVSMKGGARLTKVVGVIRNFHVYSLKEEIDPLLLYINPEYFYNMIVRVHPGAPQGTMIDLQSIWKEVLPDAPFESQHLKDAYNRLYLSEEKAGQLFTFFSMLAIFITCLGLFGLVSFMAERRTKEIGIRKTLGASVPKVVSLLVKDFSRWVVASNIIAWPVAYYAVARWLQNYAYRIHIDVWVFFISGALTLIIALITVGFQAVKAASANPVETLRHE